MDETRINELIDIFKELAELAGGYEETKIMPNLEVIDATPADLPANFIIISDDEGFYTPAIKAAGLIVSDGDFVNVLFIKGTEPIAFQHGSASGGGGSDGWPFDAYTVGSTGNTNYTTIGDALAAVPEKPLVIFGEAYTEGGLDCTGRILIALGKVSITNTTSDYGMLIDRDTVLVGQFDITTTRNNAGAIVSGIKYVNSSASVVTLNFLNISATANNSAGGGAAGWWFATDSAGGQAMTMAECVGYGNSVGGSDYSVLVECQATITVQFGSYSQAWTINHASATVQMIGPLLGTAPVLTSGTLRGFYTTTLGAFVTVANTKMTLGDGATTSPLNITERSAAPSSPATNDIYLDDGTNTDSGNPGFRRYTGAAWEDVGGGGGVEAGIWLINGTTVTLQATLSAAITAAVSGDTIVVWPGSYACNGLTLPSGVELELKPGAILTDTAQYILTCAGSNRVYGGGTVEKTGSTAVQAAAIRFTGNDVIVEDITAICSNSHASGFGFGYYQTDQTGIELRNCYADTTGTTATNYAYRKDTSAGGTCVIIDGSYNGDDGSLYNDQTGAVSVYDARLLASTPYAGGGSFSGWYFDSSDNRKSLAVSLDVFPDKDNWGLWNRFVNYGRNPIEHWHNDADDIVWTGWASYTGYATPANISRTNSKLTVSHSGATRGFYYRPFIDANVNLYARCSGALAVEVGVMVDDGVGNADGLGANNFARVFVEWPSATANANLAWEYRVGGSATVTKNTGLSLAPQDMWGVVLDYGTGTRWSSWNAIARIIGTAGSRAFVATIASALSWTPVRHGLYFRVTTSGRASIWDWFEEG